MSDIFTNNIVAGFSGAVKCRNPTAYGTVLQGVFIVIFYAISIALINSELI